MISTDTPLCAVVVSFNPDKDFEERLSKIINICDDIIIVDNSLVPWKGEYNQKHVLSGKTHLISNQKNLGIGKALNQGIIHAFTMGYTQVITFDQDTIVLDNLRSSLNKISIKVGSKLSIIGCNYWSTHKKKNRYQCVNAEMTFKETKTVITSGMLLTKEVLDHIGLFREDFFIDSVDHEFCLRARQGGIKIYHSCDSLMRHSIGLQQSHVRIFPILAFNHTPVRKYYMSRNTLITIASYWRTEPLWASKQIVRLSIELASILLIETDKRVKLEATWVGVKHAFQYKMGKAKVSFLERWEG